MSLNLGNAFNPLYSGIHRIRMLIEMHSSIAAVAKAGKLYHQNFWGCLQSNVIIGAVLIELFSISGNFPLKRKILNILNNEERQRFKDILSKLHKEFNDYKKIRDALAHKSKDNDYRHILVSYTKILTLLDEYESELDDIICARYDSYNLTSTTKELDYKYITGPTIIKQISLEKTKYYYCHEKKRGFTNLKNTELYDKIKFPCVDIIEKVASSSLPKKTLIDINNVRLNQSYIKPETRPNAENFPAIADLNKILNLETGT